MRVRHQLERFENGAACVIACRRSLGLKSTPAVHPKFRRQVKPGGTERCSLGIPPLSGSTGGACERLGTIHCHSSRAQWLLARQENLSAYDAAYLQLAIELNASLATFDQTLGAAAERVLGGRF